MDASVSLVAATAALAVMGFTWLASLAVRDASLADIAWGMVFVLIGWACYLAGDRSGAMLLAACLVTVWGLRLAIHIGRRNLGHGEDKRYQAMRAKRPKSFWITSLFTVFILQGALALIISAPFQSLGAQDSESIGILSWLGAAVFVVGFCFEAIGGHGAAEHRVVSGFADAIEQDRFSLRQLIQDALRIDEPRTILESPNEGHLPIGRGLDHIAISFEGR